MSVIFILVNAMFLKNKRHTNETMKKKKKIKYMYLDVLGIHYFFIVICFLII